MVQDIFEYRFQFDKKLKHIDLAKRYVRVCTGCEGGCYQDCATGHCSSGCKAVCENSCDTTCEGDCYRDCGDECDGCSGSCQGSCSSTCYGGCDGSCKGGCYSSCSTSCSGGCRTTCNNRCNTACTAENQAALIANLGLSDIMYAHEMKTIKNAIENEFARRGISYSNPYSIPIEKGLKTFTEYGLKIMEDVYNFNHAYDYRGNIVTGERATKAQMQPAIDYIKTLMVQVVY